MILKRSLDALIQANMIAVSIEICGVNDGAFKCSKDLFRD
jgi:hypothetical protein